MGHYYEPSQQTNEHGIEYCRENRQQEISHEQNL